MGKVKVLVMIFEKIFWNKNITYWFSQKYPNFVFVNGLNNILYIHEYSSDILTKTNFMKYLKYFFPNYLKPKNVFFQDWNKEAGGSWTFHVSNIFKEDIPNQWDLLYFGILKLYGVKEAPNTKWIRVIRKPFYNNGFHAYFLSLKGAKKLYSFFNQKTFEEQIDIFFRNNKSISRRF